MPGILWSNLYHIEPYKNGEYRSNLVALGAAMAHTELKNMFDVEDIKDLIRSRWPKKSEENIASFEAGLATLK